MSNYNVAEIKQKLASLFSPFANKSLGSMDAIKHVGIDNEKDVVVLIINIVSFLKLGDEYMTIHSIILLFIYLFTNCVLSSSHLGTSEYF